MIVLRIFPELVGRSVQNLVEIGTAVLKGPGLVPGIEPLTVQSLDRIPSQVPLIWMKRS